MHGKSGLYILSQQMSVKFAMSYQNSYFFSGSQNIHVQCPFSVIQLITSESLWYYFQYSTSLKSADGDVSFVGVYQEYHLY